MQNYIDDPVLDQITEEDAKTGSIKYTYSLKELRAMNTDDAPHLWDPFYKSQGVHANVGEPDSAKSMFHLNLAMAIANKEKSFLGYQLNWKYGRAIFIETEDDAQDMAFRTKRILQAFGMKPENEDDLIVHVPDITNRQSKDAVIEFLTDALVTKPVDIIVVSSFGDVFIGNDSNSNEQMRETVNLYNSIAKRFNTLVVFIHHLNKSGYGKNPHQKNVLGGSGFGQKVRLISHLTNGDDGIKYLSFVKGNHLSHRHKQNSLVLKFEEETFTFSNTGETIPTKEIEQRINSTDTRKTKIDWLKIFRDDEELQRKDIIDRGDILGYTRATLDNRIKEELFKGARGIYARP